MINDSIKVKGNLDIVLKDADGNVKDSRSVRNLLVDDGAEYIAARMITNSGLMSHMAIGEGTTSPVAGNDALESDGFVKFRPSEQQAFCSFRPRNKGDLVPFLQQAQATVCEFSPFDVHTPSKGVNHQIVLCVARMGVGGTGL